MSPITWIKAYVLGVLADLREPFDVPDPPADAKPLPPLVPPEALAMLRRPDPPQPGLSPGQPPRGSLRDRIRKAR